MPVKYNKAPFSPHYAFKATRYLVLNGIGYEAGDLIDKTDVSDYRLRQMFDGRKIEPVVDFPSAEDQQTDTKFTKRPKKRVQS